VQKPMWASLQELLFSLLWVSWQQCSTVCGH
jgi:hypothetical protein